MEGREKSKKHTKITFPVSFFSAALLFDYPVFLVKTSGTKSEGKRQGNSLVTRYEKITKKFISKACKNYQ